MDDPSLDSRSTAAGAGAARRSPRRLSGALLLVALTAAELSAQPGQIADEVFEDSLAVLEIEVPVQVLRDGAPVRGLTETDFTLLDGGVEQPIVGFEVVDLSRARSQATPRSGAAASRPEVQRSLLVLIDFSFNAAQLVARAIRATRTMVEEQLHPDDRVAVVALGAQGKVSILTGFTADRERLGTALELSMALADRRRSEARELARQLDQDGPRTAEERSAAYGAAASEAFGAGIDQLVAANELGIATVSAGVNSGVEVDAASGLGAAAGGSGIEEAFAIGTTLASFSRFQATAGFAEAVGNLGSLLRGVSGQKQALLFSQGPPADTLVSGAGQGAQEGGAMVAQAMERMIEQLGRAGWPVNTFGQGLRFNSSLFYLSEETGGVAYENRNRIEEATTEMVEQTSVTYLLRFVATDVPRDGRRHPLEVRVDAADVEVRHRPHYFAPRPDVELSDVERRIQAAERELDTELRALAATVLPLRIPGDDGDRLLLALQIAAEELASLAVDRRVELEVVAAAERPDPADVLRQRVDLDLEKMGSIPPGGLVVIGDLDLADDDSAVRVSVTSGALGTSTALSLAPRAPDQPVTQPPLLFATGAQRLIVRESGEEPPPTLPVRIDGQERVPRLDPVVQRGSSLGVALLLLGPNPEERIGGLRIVDATGAPVPMESAIAFQEETRSPDALQLLFTVDTTDLAAGVYGIEGLWPEDVAPAQASRFRVIEP